MASFEEFKVLTEMPSEFNSNTFYNNEFEIFINYIDTCDFNMANNCYVQEEPDVIDLDNFFREIEEYETENDNEKYSNLENVDIDSINTNQNVKTGTSNRIKPQNETDFVSSSFNESTISSDKNLHSIEDDIPLNIIAKQKNDNNFIPNASLTDNKLDLIDIKPYAETQKVDNQHLYSCITNLKFIDENFEWVDDSDGYHSSDFEFITENEAKTAGLYTRAKSKTNKRRNAIKRHQETENDHKNNFSIQSTELSSDDALRLNHQIPTGEDYLNLFRGYYTPTISGFNENKAFHVSSMNIEFKGIGFDMKMHKRPADDEKHKKEANNVAQMIRQMYPVENCKRIRRNK